MIYNRLLKSREGGLHRGLCQRESRPCLHGAALDQHQTKLYNFFAQPPAKIGFCRAADAEAAQALSVSAAEFPAYAAKALDRLEAPILAFYADYDRYRHELAAWKANPHEPARVMTAAAASKLAGAHKQDGRGDAGSQPSRQPPVVAQERRRWRATDWRVQLGAFSGQPAAEAAWKRAREKVPSMAGYTPSYEPVPGKPSLVRLQLAMTDGRDSAQKLCASAAANGVNCLPVAR